MKHEAITVVVTRADGLRQWELIERASLDGAHEHHDTFGDNFRFRRDVGLEPPTSAWWWL